MKLNSKRFVIRKSLVGKNAIITVNFKNGKTATYSHDKVYEVMKDKLEAMACFIKYKSYTATNNVPLVAREICEQSTNTSAEVPIRLRWLKTQLSNVQRLINNANNISSLQTSKWCTSEFDSHATTKIKLN